MLAALVKAVPWIIEAWDRLREFIIPAIAYWRGGRAADEKRAAQDAAASNEVNRRITDALSDNADVPSQREWLRRYGRSPAHDLL